MILFNISYINWFFLLIYKILQLLIILNILKLQKKTILLLINFGYIIILNKNEIQGNFLIYEKKSYICYGIAKVFINGIIIKY